MAILGVDVGTTHCKAGLFGADGTAIHIASRPTRIYRTDDGLLYHDPEELWQTVAATISDARGGDHDVEAVGVASMAEAGLLVDRRIASARTHIIPWYDTRSVRQMESIARRDDALAAFQRSGLFPSFKYGLPKILWLQEQDPKVTRNAVWLSVADYVVCRLTGIFCTDPSLAARTYCFRIREGVWDDPWIERFGLDLSLFPPIQPSGEPAGVVTREAARETGLRVGTLAAICGHDHICAMLAGGVVEPGPVLDSMGTAESLLGVLPRLELGQAQMDSGLTIVPSMLEGRHCWLGGVRSSGGSVEWLRTQLGDEPLDYARMMALAATVPPEPTGILFYPFLSGAGSPRPDEHVRAAFSGLDARHGRGDLVRAVLEGTSFEVEAVRAAAQQMIGRSIDDLIVVGGGSRNRLWLQIKADVTDCVCIVPDLPEPAALGAALAVGMRYGLVDGIDGVMRVASRLRATGVRIEPNAQRHEAYQRLYREAYLPLQDSLRAAARPRSVHG